MSITLVYLLLFIISISALLWSATVQNKSWCLFWLFVAIFIVATGPTVVPLSNKPPKIIPYESIVIVNDGFYKGHYGEVRRLVRHQYMVKILGKFKISEKADPESSERLVRLEDGKVTQVVNLYPNDKRSKDLEFVDAKDCEKL